MHAGTWRANLAKFYSEVAANMKVRQIVIADAPEVQAIYAPYVAATTISFEEVPPDILEVERRIAALLPHYPYLVAEVDGQVVGYAYASEHRTRAAYRTSVDVTVYVAPGAQRSGVARGLYSRLLPAAASRGYHAAFAGIALPNKASVALHEAMGFEPVGIYREVGRKFDAWHDVGWWQRRL
ncbi:arsinothricin resistance N-acetyltransferase ArsN1 family B [Sphingopyxis solisilvae]|uniref:arsinothricin resistance N-acetyltransferase ArsN1 family B n=1 Tax=Sphingopyxis solisilvae TaxID=1886788 RepID=UPI001E29912E|nr:arsinothricin resistance N-acetyltransferase ArsN1 family B [Sphingopyxis solisilvae]